MSKERLKMVWNQKATAVLIIIGTKALYIMKGLKTTIDQELF